MDVQVLGDPFKFCPSQLRVDGVLPRGKERAGCYTWWREEVFGQGCLSFVSSASVGQENKVCVGERIKSGSKI